MPRKSAKAEIPEEEIIAAEETVSTEEPIIPEESAVTDDSITTEETVSTEEPIIPEESIPAEEPEAFAYGEEPEDLVTSEAVLPNDPAPEDAPPPSDRQAFSALKFNELDRGLTPEQRQEWQSIYASYRSRSVMTGIIAGVDVHQLERFDTETQTTVTEKMHTAIVIPYRVRIVIPANEMWMKGSERPNFVLRNMVGAKIDFVITKVDREGGFAVASRRMASRSRRYFFSTRPNIHAIGARIPCKLLAVGPRRCLVECFGYDMDLTQREMRYDSIPDLRTEYHPGDVLKAMVTSYDAEESALMVSVKETTANPFDGAEFRHPVGARRLAVVSGKYGGGVFCNLPDGTVCMCSYAFQYEDADFPMGTTAIIIIQRHETTKKQMYGKILSKWQ